MGARFIGKEIAGGKKEKGATRMDAK